MSIALMAAAFTPAPSALASVTTTGYISMRDGVRLHYILIRPPGRGRFPVLMDYGPYNSGQDPSAYYPFVPAGEKKRNNEREFQLKAQIDKDLPIEPELERWFPLWEIPL